MNLQKMFLLLSIILLTLFMPMPKSAAQVSESNAKAVADEYLKAFNSGNDKLFSDFITHHLSPEALATRSLEERIKSYNQIKENLGKLEVYRTIGLKQNTFIVRAKSSNGIFLELLFDFTVQSPNNLQGVQFERLNDPDEDTSNRSRDGLRSGAPSGPVTSTAIDTNKPATTNTTDKSSDLNKRISDFMASQAAAGYSGALIVAKNGEVVLAKAYGLANRATNLPFTTDMVVNTGSITKMFTGAAILKLEMQGKLKTTDPISKYIKNVPADKAAITIHQLLTHEAGFKHTVGNGDFEKLDRDEFIRRAMAAELEAPPGRRAKYSNVGISLAAVIVELASGQSYEQYLHENLFKPAGMTQTGYQIPKWKAETIAHGYKNNEDWGTMPSHWPGGRPYWNQLGNGALQTTVGDMYRWYVALRGNTLLSAEAKQKFFTPYAQEENGDLFFGYGCGVFKTPHGKLVVKNGGNGILFADFRWYLDEDLMYFIASTNAEKTAFQASSAINRLLFENK